MVYNRAADPDELLPNEGIVLAVVCNATTLPKDIDYTFNLMKMDISESDFMDLFFNYTNHYFHINANNCHNSILSLKNKHYMSHTNHMILLNFPHLMLTLASDKKKQTHSTLSGCDRIHALKCASKIPSLAYVHGYQQAFSWFEMMDILVESNTIVASSNPLDIAYAHLIIQFVFVDPVIDIAVAINFNFNVALSGYLNPSNDIAPIPCHYSKEEKNTHSPYTNHYVVSKASKSAKLNSGAKLVSKIKHTKPKSVPIPTPVAPTLIFKHQEEKETEESESEAESEIDTIKYKSDKIFEQIQQVQKNFSDSDIDSESDGEEDLSIGDNGDNLSRWL